MILIRIAMTLGYDHFNSTRFGGVLHNCCDIFIFAVLVVWFNQCSS